MSTVNYLIPAPGHPKNITLCGIELLYHPRAKGWIKFGRRRRAGNVVSMHMIWDEKEAREYLAAVVKAVTVN